MNKVVEFYKRDSFYICMEDVENDKLYAIDCENKVIKEFNDNDTIWDFIEFMCLDYYEIKFMNLDFAKGLVNEMMNDKDEFVKMTKEFMSFAELYFDINEIIEKWISKKINYLY